MNLYWFSVSHLAERIYCVIFQCAKTLNLWKIDPNITRKIHYFCWKLFKFLLIQNVCRKWIWCTFQVNLKLYFRLKDIKDWLKSKREEKTIQNKIQQVHLFWKCKRNKTRKFAKMFCVPLAWFVGVFVSSFCFILSSFTISVFIFNSTARWVSVIFLIIKKILEIGN